MRGLFLEGLIFGGAYVRREICVSESIVLVCSGKEICHFALFYFEFDSKFHVQAPRGAYIRRGDLTEGFLRYNLEGLIFGIFGILRYLTKKQSCGARSCRRSH